jgi:hypothetical protein
MDSARAIYKTHLRRILEEHAVDDVPSANWGSY